MTKIYSKQRLEKVVIKGYKSIGFDNPVTLSLGSVNLLLGANGAGKSKYSQLLQDAELYDEQIVCALCGDGRYCKLFVALRLKADAWHGGNFDFYGWGVRRYISLQAL